MASSSSRPPRSWRHHGSAPEVGDLWDLEEVDDLGRPTGRRVRARVETAPEGQRRSSSTQRLFAVEIPVDLPNLCRCRHLRGLHVADGVGACTICADYALCSTFRPMDPREEP